MPVPIDILPDQLFRGRENTLSVEVGLVRKVGMMPDGKTPIYQSRTVEIEIREAWELQDLEFVAEALYEGWEYQCTYLNDFTYYC